MPLDWAALEELKTEPDRVTRRIGRFYIDEHHVRFSTALVREIMAKCVILRCEYDYAKQRFEYVAISPLFREVQPGDEFMTYRWTLEFTEPLGQVSVTCV